MAKVKVECINTGVFAMTMEHELDLVRHIRPGELAEVDITQPRNWEFHKKYFAMMQHAFTHWQPPPTIEHRGETIYVEKNFENFRDQVTILAGFHHTTFTLTGQPRLIAKSISFANMDDAEFRDLYSKSVDVINQNVFCDNPQLSEDFILQFG